MPAERHVAAPAERAVGSERAPGTARVGVVAALAEPPQLARAAVARECDLLRIPDPIERQLADVAARVRGRGQRRTALHGAVGLDAHHELSGLAALPVAILATRTRAQQLLVGAVVPQVV